MRKLILQWGRNLFQRHCHRNKNLVSSMPVFASDVLLLMTSRGYSAESSSELPLDLLRIMKQRIIAIEQKNSYLQQQINQEVVSVADYSRANKELRELGSSMELIKQLRSIEKEIDGLKSLMSDCAEDKDMSNMAAEELEQALVEERRFQHLLLKSLLPKDDADERDCILEVRAGTGGEEASLFAMDIFKMYEKYAQKRGWNFDVIATMESNIKGYKEASGTISGPGVYGRLKFESGIHRVQV